MKPRSLLAVAGAVGGEPVDADDVGISSVQTDSRLVGAGALFVALAGEHADGHAFVGDAFDHGATAALVRSGFVVNGPAVLVPDTGQALLDLAADERRGFAGTVVAITGANGKTSTKDMAAAVCAERFRTHASPRSFNNEVGLPMTLLGASPDTEVVIAELGARHVGDVQRLMPIADPSIAVVTNVGVAHMEVFGSWEAIVDASAEPIEALDEEDLAILNADDAVASTFADRTRARVRSFGRGADAAVRADDVSLAPDGCASFDLVADGRRVPCLARGARRAHGAQRVGGRGGGVGAGRAAGGVRVGAVGRPHHTLAHGDDRDRSAGCASSTTRTTRTPNPSPRR